MRALGRLRLGFSGLSGLAAEAADEDGDGPPIGYNGAMPAGDNDKTLPAAACPVEPNPVSLGMTADAAPEPIASPDPTEDEIDDAGWLCI